MTDPLDLLDELRPDAATLEHEWPAAERTRLRHELTIATAPTRYVARRRLRRVGLPAAALAIAAAMVGLLVALVPGGNPDAAHDDTDRGTAALAEPFDPGAVVATPRVGKGHYAYRVITSYERRNGDQVVADVTELWVSPDGTTRAVHSKSPDPSFAGRCFLRRQPAITQAALDELPTDPDALYRYLRTTVRGSSTRDEAVFSYVDDLLGESDLLATSTFRAALVGALSRTGGVAVHRNVDDYVGRDTVRVDFADPDNRPGELQSLYFAPGTYQYLGSVTSRITPGPARSLGYDHRVPDAHTPDTLLSPTDLTVVTGEAVVTSLPKRLGHCTVSNTSGG